MLEDVNPAYPLGYHSFPCLLGNFQNAPPVQVCALSAVEGHKLTGWLSVAERWLSVAEASQSIRFET
jgi:hypothetical protein